MKDESNPDGDIEIVITGLRPGEKLYEELLIGDNPEATQHPRIMKAHEDYLPWGELTVRINDLSQALQANHIGMVRQILQELIAGYQPTYEIVDWVSLGLGQALKDDAFHNAL